VLKVAGVGLAAELRAALSGCDDYADTGKPQIDWDDPGAREALIASRARDGYAVLAVLQGRELAERVTQAAVLLATVLGQDLDRGPDGAFGVARRVAKDRVISTVDPDARHGHKTSSRGFDGYKGHVAVDPDSEIITATTVTPGNTGDGVAAEELISDLLHDEQQGEHDDEQQGEQLRDRGSTATLLTAPASSMRGSVRRGSGRAARPRRRPHRVECSARTASTSTSVGRP
jgi:hypothetical protein